MKQFTIVALSLLPAAFALPAQQDALRPALVPRAATCKNFYLSKLDGSGNGPWTCCCANQQCTVSWGVKSTASLNEYLGGNWSPVDAQYQMYVAAGTRCDH